MHIRAINFDMDGLMIDTESLYWAAGGGVARRYGKQVQDATLGRMMGRSPIDSMRVFATELGIEQDYASLLEERDVIVFRQMQAGVTPMPGLLEVLVQLKARFRLGICTSARTPFVKVALEGLGIERYFDAIQTSEGVTNGKPDPEIYLKAITKLDARPGECVVLEDSSNGALAAKRAGAYTIAVPSVYTREQDFAFVNYVAKDLKDAAGHIAALAEGGGPGPAAAAH